MFFDIQNKELANKVYFFLNQPELLLSPFCHLIKFLLKTLCQDLKKEQNLLTFVQQSNKKKKKSQFAGVDVLKN